MPSHAHADVSVGCRLLNCSGSGRQPGSALPPWLWHVYVELRGYLVIRFQIQCAGRIASAGSAGASPAGEERYVLAGTGGCCSGCGCGCCIGGVFGQRYGRRDLLCAVSLAREPKVAAAHRSRSRPGKSDLKVNESSTGQPVCRWLASRRRNGQGCGTAAQCGGGELHSHAARLIRRYRARRAAVRGDAEGGIIGDCSAGDRKRSGIGVSDRDWNAGRCLPRGDIHLAEVRRLRNGRFEG